MTIIVSKNGSNAKIVKPTGFDEERSLQEYIHENPESIPIHELREDKKLLGVPVLTPSFIANLHAMEVIKILLGRGRIFRNIMLHADLEGGQLSEFSFQDGVS